MKMEMWTETPADDRAEFLAFCEGEGIELFSDEVEDDLRGALVAH